MMRAVNVKYRFDSSDIVRGLNNADKVMRAGTLRGLKLAGVMWMTDAIVEMPEAPMDTGALKSSASVFVSNRFVAASPNVWRAHSAWGSKERPTPYKGYLSDRNGRGLTATVMFNKPYAGQWHERWPNSGRFQSPRAGVKYLESKMYTHGRQYLEALAVEIRKAMST